MHACVKCVKSSSHIQNVLPIPLIWAFISMKTSISADQTRIKELLPTLQEIFYNCNTGLAKNKKQK